MSTPPAKTDPADSTCAVADWPAPPLRVWPHRTPAAQGAVVRKHTGTAWAVPTAAPASNSRTVADSTQAAEARAINHQLGVF